MGTSLVTTVAGQASRDCRSSTASARRLMIRLTVYRVVSFCLSVVSAFRRNAPLAGLQLIGPIE